MFGRSKTDRERERDLRSRDKESPSKVLCDRKSIRRSRIARGSGCWRDTDEGEGDVCVGLLCQLPNPFHSLSFAHPWRHRAPTIPTTPVSQLPLGSWMESRLVGVDTTLHPRCSFQFLPLRAFFPICLSTFSIPSLSSIPCSRQPLGNACIGNPRCSPTCRWSWKERINDRRTHGGLRRVGCEG